MKKNTFGREAIRRNELFFLDKQQRAHANDQKAQNEPRRMTDSELFGYEEEEIVSNR